jgi:YD repeat-containing protein
MNLIGTLGIWRRVSILLLAAGLLVSTAQAALVTYTVDPASGRVTKATYPDGSYITYGYDLNGNRTSAVVTDLGAPTSPVTVTFSSITTTSAVVSWTGSSDNVGVTSYEYSKNGGSTWTNNGPSLSVTLTGLTASTAYTVLVHAKDAANNTSANTSGSFTTLAPPDTSPPSAPGVPTISNLAATSARATWTVATDNVAVTAYEYSLNGGTSWTSNGMALFVDLAGLTNGTSYTIKVRARDAANNIGAASSKTFVTLDNAAPTAPGNPTFSNITATGAGAAWTIATDNVGVTAYEYSLNNGGTWTSNGTALTVTLTGLTGSTNYTLWVRAKDAAGNTSTSGSASFTTTSAADTSPPTMPGAPTFTNPAPTSITATWTGSTDNVGVTAYEYSLNGGSTWTSNGLALSVNLSALTSGTTYTLKVRARDAANNVSTASQNSFTTPDNAPPTTPGTPTFSGITATAFTGSWTGSTDNVAVTAYEYSFNGGAWTSNGTALTVTFSGLASATSYSLQVRAKDAAGNISSPSGTASVTTLDNMPPTTPGTPTFSGIGATSFTANWTGSTDNVAVTAYEYSFNSGAWTSNGASLTATFTGLTSATSYSLQVRAKDAAGNISSPSGTASVTTLDNIPPTTPGTPTFSPGANSATASWTGSTDNVAVTAYEYSFNSGAWTSNGGSLTATFTGLTSATTYSLQVRARDAAGNIGGPGGVGTFTTLDNVPPNAPGAPGFSLITSSSVAASWGIATDNVGVTSYEYSINSGSSWTNIGNATATTISGLSASTTYTVLVRGRDAAGNAGATNQNSVTTLPPPDTSPPGLPGTPGFSNIQPTLVSVSWGAASDNVGVTSYEYSINGGASWTNVGNTTSTTISGLSPGTGYNVQVHARDAAGNTGSASSASVTTIAQITIANRNVSTTIPGGGPSAIYQLTTAGDIMVTQPSSATAIDGGDWLAPKIGMSGFQVFATLAPGSAACGSGGMGSWLDLTSNLTWAVGRGGPSGTTACSFDIQIRNSGNPSVILGTARIGLSATN